MSVPAKWFTEPVSVQTLTGTGSLGPNYSAAVTGLANLDPTMKLVVRGLSGFISRNSGAAEVVSQTTIGVPPTFGPDSLDSRTLFAPGSLVTAEGDVSEVISVQAFRKFGVIQYVAVTI